MNAAELIVDSFAGGGGASTGIEWALGRSPDYAINHDAVALAMHRANHPDTEHLVTDIWEIDPAEVAAGQKIGLLWASPDCKDFSKAKGGAVKDRNIRDLAWTICRWAELPRDQRPRVIIVENVEEFLGWGPIGEDGERIKEFAGITFQAWVKRCRDAGYSRIQWRELRACDYGAPTIRKRLFVVMRSDGRPIVWPKPTHGDPKSDAVRSGKLKPWRTAAECIDWSLPCPSIFDTSAEIMAKHGVRAKRPLAPATLRRIARGIVRYVLENPSPFIVNVANSKTTGRGPNAWPLDEPTRTITPGGSHALVTPFVSLAQQGGSNRAASDPMHTICASPKDQNTLVAPVLVPRYGEREGQEPRCLPIDAPGPVVVPTGNGAGLVAATLTAFYGDGEGGKDRSRPMEAPLVTDTSGGNRHGLVAAFLAQHNAGPRNGEISGRPADEPISTISTTGAQQQLVSARLTLFNQNRTGSELDQPAPTITANSYVKRPGGAAPIGMVAAHMLNLHGTNEAGAPANEPARTVAAGGTHAGMVAAFLQAYYGTDQDTPLDEPYHTDTTKPRFGLVTVEIDGTTYAIVDIGMRMLTPRERFRAQGFGDDYVIEEGVDPDALGWKRRLTAEQQGRMCGNSVCPPLAEALVRANCSDLAIERSADVA